MARVPRLTAGCDVRSLGLHPSEARVLSHVDATLDEAGLSAATGLDPLEVVAALERLRALGAVELFEAPAGDGGSPGGAPAQPTDLELSPERRRQIDEMFGRLENLDYYALLGVPPDADKKQIKSAYYKLAPEYHPDKYFRKKLGAYQPKIEAIFSRVTLAHDVLTSKERRAEYDAYIAQSERNRSMAELLAWSQDEAAELASAVEASATAMAGGRPSGTTPAVAPQPRVPLVPRGPETVESRRETLARKLAGGMKRPPSGQLPGAPRAAAPSLDPGISAQASLRARYEAAKEQAVKSQLARLLEGAQAALAKNDHAAAANAYRLAASLAPNDADLQKEAAVAQRTAAAALAEGYMKQGQYEASQERWVEAALSFTKVCEGRPDDPRAHERASFALVKSGGNARTAVEHARRAVELAPKSAEFHVALGRAYFWAGLDKSAAGELSRALELAQTDAKIKDAIAALRENPPRPAR